MYQAMKLLNGLSTRRTEPVWGPLDDLLGDQLASWFMWMGEVKLDDGTLVQMYKHTWTRRYIHLSDTGLAFEYRSPDAYEPVSTLDSASSALLSIDYPGRDEALSQWLTRLQQPDKHGRT